MPSLNARALPKDIPGSGWYEELPPPAPPRELEGDISADWVIVGAGFAGLATARRLIQLVPGDKIVLLDAQRIGFGSAGRNSGFMIDLPHELNSDSYVGGLEADRRQIEMNRSAIDFARHAVADYGLEEYFDPCGKYHGASNAAGLKALGAFEDQLSRLGEQFEQLDADGMKRLTGTDFYISGTFTPGAAILQPAGYIRGFAEGLRPDVEIYENSPVTKIESGKPHVLHTPNGRITAPKVILTVNGHLESFGLFARRLMHIYTYASMTRAMTDAEAAILGGAPHWALIPANPMGTTVRRTKDKRLLIRNSITYNPDMKTSLRQVEKMGRVHDRSFKARFPMLPDLEMQHRWGGLVCISLNSVPAFGEVEQGIFAAGCQNALGVCKGTFYGKLIAELATGTESKYLPQALAEEAPKRLPPDPFMTIGARAHLWWAQKRAGTDL